MTLPAGRRVRVSARAHEGHHRTPGYLKGRTGTVERGHGVFTNPEARADKRPQLFVPDFVELPKEPEPEQIEAPVQPQQPQSEEAPPKPLVPVFGRSIRRYRRAL